MESKDVMESFKNILEIVQKCDTLSSEFVKDGKIENAADYLMDAQILKMSHDLMGSTAEKMGNSEFSDDEYIAALTSLFTIDTGEHSFEKLDDIAVKCCKASHFLVPMLGTFDFEAAPRPEKVRKEARRAEKKPLGPAKAPTNVTQLTRSTKGAEKINIVRGEIQRVCRERETDEIPYYELVCDPNNFMKSVDIAFQISFLVRDGFLGLKQLNSEPYVFLVDHDPNVQQTQRTQAPPSDTVQCVMSFSPFVWQEKVKKFALTSPLLELEDDGDEDQNGAMEVDSD